MATRLAHHLPDATPCFSQSPPPSRRYSRHIRLGDDGPPTIVKNEADEDVARREGSVGGGGGVVRAVVEEPIGNVAKEKAERVSVSGHRRDIEEGITNEEEGRFGKRRRTRSLAKGDRRRSCLRRQSVVVQNDGRGRALPTAHC